MSSALKLLIPGVLALYFAAACAPDLDSLSASYTAAGGAPNGEGGSGNTAGGAPIDKCENGKTDSNESDTDCGGTSLCVRCAKNAICKANRDCESQQCMNGHCTQPSCTDELKNQDETGIDCGGTCLPCDIDTPCETNADCSGQYCLDGVCADHCSSNVKESDETDKDCGGATCDPCEDTKGCKAASDCKSTICSNQKCQVATCTDQVQNQNESDKDCGGVCSATKPCAVSQHCNSSADCESWICVATTGKCAADSVVVAAADIIDDFEDGDLTGIPPLDGRVGNWYAYGDPSSVATQDVATVNRGKSHLSLRTKGKMFSGWGSGVGVDLAHGSGDKLTYDASDYIGVTFWARAVVPEDQTAVTLSVILPDIDTDKLVKNKTCTECDHHYLKGGIQLTDDWQRFVVSFDDLTLEPGGLPTPVPAFNKAALSSVQFRLASGQEYDIYIDDVAFVKP
jgi:hypothetical protein